MRDAYVCIIILATRSLESIELTDNSSDVPCDLEKQPKEQKGIGIDVRFSC